ncbi:hypothetical protein LX32DRAFT_215939 [Colletotrichum zoysiae]|uniref:Uncharacterized protein n=1 Tax=Colletotrichum zoysiae TaxID=1216348 RepID=A0AAD9H562_9PEZI|nr:hypothetical protein LX32DRAFT_215939 [Colletotrichum zoysiae]
MASPPRRHTDSCDRHVTGGRGLTRRLRYPYGRPWLKSAHAGMGRKRLFRSSICGSPNVPTHDVCAPPQSPVFLPDCDWRVRERQTSDTQVVMGGTQERDLTNSHPGSMGLADIQRGTGAERGERSRCQCSCWSGHVRRRVRVLRRLARVRWTRKGDRLSCWPSF